LASTSTGRQPMSAERFDELAKALATGSSRRTVLKALAATAAGGVLALLGGKTVEAGGKKCSNDCDCPSHSFCTSGGVCVHFTCTTKGSKPCRLSRTFTTCIPRSQTCNPVC